MPAIRKSGRKSTSTSGLSFAINGVALKPTIVFDTFWRFAAERQAIDERRREGQPQPWTEDRILRKHRFCNVFRLSDRHSQYIVREVIEKGLQDPVEVAFRVVLYNTFTNVGTYELLERKLGPLTWAGYDREVYRQVLQKAKEEGQALYTGSFQKPAPKLGHNEAYLNHLVFLEVLMTNDLPGRLAKCKYMADAFEWLLTFPGMGNFNAYQLLLDLSYSDIINFSGADFVVAGLGACSGLSKCFGRSPSLTGHEAGIIRWMYETQDEHFARLGLTFKGLGPDNLPMQLCDIEHTLCEVDKYSRVAHPKILGLHGRTQIRGQTFLPSNDYMREIHIPKAWSHPDRQIVRIRPGSVGKVEKRYVVEKIVKSRNFEGKVQYFVEWVGYPKSASTWEPAKNIKEDAPLAVEEFEGKE